MRRTVFLSLQKRLICYVSTLFVVVSLSFVLLLTGYSYSRNEGFRSSPDGPMNMIQALETLPHKVLWPVVLLVVTAIVIEVCIKCIQVYKKINSP